MITESEALELAEEARRRWKKEKYKFVNIEFVLAREKPFRSEAMWIVRYQKPQPVESVIDDGEQLFVVKIDPETKKTKVAKPL